MQFYGFKMCGVIILLLIEEDRNQSSANLFSGLRSGVWSDETKSALTHDN